MCYHAHKGPVRFILPVNPVRRPASAIQSLIDSPSQDELDGEEEEEEETPRPLELLPPPPGPHGGNRSSTEALPPDVSTSYEGMAASRESLTSHGRMVGGWKVGNDYVLTNVFRDVIVWLI